MAQQLAAAAVVAAYDTGTRDMIRTRTRLLVDHAAKPVPSGRGEPVVRAVLGRPRRAGTRHVVAGAAATAGGRVRDDRRPVRVVPLGDQLVRVPVELERGGEQFHAGQAADVLEQLQKRLGALAEVVHLIMNKEHTVTVKAR